MVSFLVNQVPSSPGKPEKNEVNTQPVFSGNNALRVTGPFTRKRFKNHNLKSSVIDVNKEMIKTHLIDPKDLYFKCKNVKTFLGEESLSSSS